MSEKFWKGVNGHNWNPQSYQLALNYLKAQTKDEKKKVLYDLTPDMKKSFRARLKHDYVVLKDDVLGIKTDVLPTFMQNVFNNHTDDRGIVTFTKSSN